MNRANIPYLTLDPDIEGAIRADRAAAQDSVFSEIGPEFARDNGLIPVKTCCESREQYLTRPDLGRRFDQENSEIIRRSLPQRAPIQLVIGDGLSSAAILPPVRSLTLP